MKEEISNKFYIQNIELKASKYFWEADSLRHTHAFLLFEAGASIKEIQDRLGALSYSNDLLFCGISLFYEVYHPFYHPIAVSHIFIG